MLKKLLLILTFLTSSLFSFQVDIWQEGNHAVLNFNKYYDDVAGDEGTNWVAIYKEGDANDWNNVIKWEWAKDLAHNEDGNYDERVFPLVKDKGSYEVRFFLDNSYDVFSTYSYSNGENGNNASLGIADKTNNAIIFNNTTADKSWIGIYKKGDSNEWDNVKAWDWATSTSTTINISNLNSGDYEARLFYNNSYNIETSVEFTKDGGEANQANLEIKSQTNSNITFNSTDADQAWIGIYKKGDSNDWDNVKAWDWVESPTTIKISNLAQGTYEARLFYYNSYNIETSLEFTKVGDENGYPKVTREELDAMIANDEDYSKVDVSGITNMNRLFFKKEVKYDITGWDVSNVTDIRYMFYKSKLFNQPIGNWDTSSVTDMRYMFYHAEAFNQPIGNWDVSHVSDMTGVFYHAISFNHPLGDWDVSHVSNMRRLLYDAYSFNQPLGDWDVSHVTNMTSMFRNVKVFNQPLGDWDTSNVIDMSNMFGGASVYNQPMENWDVRHVTNMSNMFVSASLFNQPLEKWNVSKVTDMNGMFYNTKVFNQPLEKWNVSNVTDMHNMFALTKTFNQPLEKWDVSKVTDMIYMFWKSETFNQPLENWNVSNVTDMGFMFWESKAFNQPLKNWDVSSVIYMYKMFHNSKKFNQDISSWDVSNVSSYRYFATESNLQYSFIPPKFR